MGPVYVHYYFSRNTYEIKFFVVHDVELKPTTFLLVINFCPLEMDYIWVSAERVNRFQNGLLR